MKLIEKSPYVLKDEQHVVTNTFQAGYKYCLATHGLGHKQLQGKVKAAGKAYYNHLMGEEI